MSVSKFQVFRSRNQLTPGAYKLPFWCGEDRPAGPNTDVPAKPVQTEGLGSDVRVVQSLEGGNCLGRHFWGSAYLPLLLLAQSCLVHRHHSAGGAANSMEKVLSNKTL